MKPGDLRRFKDFRNGSARSLQLIGRPFVVLEAAEAERRADAWVSFLVDGRLEKGWGYDWVESNSEAIDPV